MQEQPEKIRTLGAIRELMTDRCGHMHQVTRLDFLRGVLSELVAAGFARHQDAADTFCLAYDATKDHVRKFHLGTSIEKTLSVHAARIFRFLLENGDTKLELDSIVRKTLLPETAASTLLAQLYKAGFVVLHDVPRTVDRSHPTTTFHLWTVDQEKAVRIVCDNMFKTARNILVRQQMSKKQVEREIRAVVRTGLVSPTPGESEANERFLKMDDWLGVGLMRLMSFIHFFEVL